MRFYQLAAGGRLKKSWFLGPPEDGDGNILDVWAFSDAKPFLETTPIVLPIVEVGEVTDFTFSSFGFVVVRKGVTEVIAKHCGESVQFVPVTILDSEELFIANPLSIIDCLDPSCVASYYPDSFYDKSKAGKPRMVIQLFLNCEHLSCPHLFRVKEWTIPIIVSEVLLQDLLLHKFSGVKGLPIKLI